MLTHLSMLSFFGFGLIVYSAILRERRSLTPDILAVASFILLGMVLLLINSDVIRGLALGASFLAAGLTPRFITPDKPLKGPDKRASDIRGGMRVGIVDFVWIMLMAAVVAFVAFANETSPFVSGVPLGRSAEYYRTDLAITQVLFERTVEVILLVGGGLSAVMAILWSGQIWAKKEEEADPHQYRQTTLVSMQMVVAYFFIATAGFIWIALPLYQHMINIRDAIP